MAEAANLSPLAGSEHQPIEGSRVVGKPHPDESVRVAIFLASNPGGSGLPSLEELGQTPIALRQHLSFGQFQARHGASTEDLNAVTSFAQQQGLQVIAQSAAKRRVELVGTAAAMNAAFGIELVQFEHPKGGHRGHEGPVHLPKSLEQIVTAVLGLDNRPVARPQIRMSEPLAEQQVAPPGSYYASQVAEAYNFPAGVDGTGQCIGVIELGGGYRTSDLETYFQKLNLQVPSVQSSGPNQPGPLYAPSSSDGEVALDLQIAGLVAPKAKFVVYFAASNTDMGFVTVIQDAIHDQVNNPSILSVSWGGPENNWPQATAQQMDQVIREGCTMGVTTFIASGDQGAQDTLTNGMVTPNFPASVPSAVSCGGTRLTASGNQIQQEVTWNDGVNSASGGGVSIYFPLPYYQETAFVPVVPNAGYKPGFAGRGVPDVAGNADPVSGYQIFVNGQWNIIAGTSAVAPLWAALYTLLNQSLGRRIGFANPHLYEHNETAVFHDITQGDNNYYAAGLGWDACTGLGSPDGTALLKSLQGTAGKD